MSPSPLTLCRFTHITWCVLVDQVGVKLSLIQPWNDGKITLLILDFVLQALNLRYDIFQNSLYDSLNNSFGNSFGTSLGDS